MALSHTPCPGISSPGGPRGARCGSSGWSSGAGSAGRTRTGTGSAGCTTRPASGTSCPRCRSLRDARKGEVSGTEDGIWPLTLPIHLLSRSLTNITCSISFLMLKGSYNWNICYHSDGMERCRGICIFFFFYFNFLYLSGWNSANSSKLRGFAVPV